MKIKIIIFLTILASLFNQHSQAEESEKKDNVEQENIHSTDPLYHGEVSGNFLIRWAFQEYCDHVFDPRTDPYVWPTNSKSGVKFDPADVKAGDVVFMRDIDLFFQKIHPKIKVPYIIVTHGEHLDAMRKRFIHYLDEENVIAWFGIHPSKILDHPKFFPLPIGVIQQPENHKKRTKLHEFFTKVRLQSEKKHVLYMNFADTDKPERKHVRLLFTKKPYCKRGQRQPFHSYLKEMASCKFTLSPKGLACDCYRTWEALLVGSIPVVRSCQLDPLYEGLPVLIVDKWEDVTEEFLNQKYEEITSKKYDLKRLYMEYWLDKIDTVRINFLAHYKTQPARE